jgi:hypothetical protein
VHLIALVIAMALPPASVFINIESARLADKQTLEVGFEWPRCASPADIKADWAGASQSADGAWSVRFSLQEQRTRPGVAACTGPTEKQSRRVDLRTLLRPDMTHGVLLINDESLYGWMKKLPALTVAFDRR